MRRLGLLLSLLMGLALSLAGASYVRSQLAFRFVSWPPMGATGREHFDLIAFPREFPSLLLGVLFYFTMLVGVVLGQLFQHLTSRPNDQVTIAELVKTLNTGRSWSAIIVSPIVFFATVSSLLALGAVPTAFFYALQNGFFCLSIFSGISAKYVSRRKTNSSGQKSA